jgi:hypothetical protein
LQEKTNSTQILFSSVAIAPHKKELANFEQKNPGWEPGLKLGTMLSPERGFCWRVVMVVAERVQRCKITQL